MFGKEVSQVEKRLRRALSLPKPILIRSCNKILTFRVGSHVVAHDLVLDEYYCDCKDFEYRGMTCKHIMRVMLLEESLIGDTEDDSEAF